jgi:nucleoside 2-deoxyribosyltransferase
MLYLACPYSHSNPLIREERFQIANRATAKLMQSGIVVFSPLSHSVTISESFDDKVRLSHEFWMSQDLPILRRCDEMLVLRLAGWHESHGVKAELFEAMMNDIPITLICEHDIEQLPAIPKQSRYFLTSQIFREINL